MWRKRHEGLGSSVKEMVRRSVVAGVMCVGFLFLVASSASAQVYTGTTPPVVVLSNTGERSAQAPVLPFQVSSSAGSVTPQANVSGLAFTGTDIMGLVTVALVALGLGTVLTRRARPQAEG